MTVRGGERRGETEKDRGRKQGTDADGQVDVDENDETASFCHIESMPTFLVKEEAESVQR